MEQKVLRGFDTLFNLAIKFIESRKGVWDHTVWLDFLSDIQKKGFETTDDLSTYMNSVLEAMKKLYDAATATKGMEKTMSGIYEQMIKYIKKTRGVWKQEDWIAFLEELQEKGIDLNDEMRSYLKEALEAIRELYKISPVFVLQYR